jgi:hypothetical protein
MVMAAILIPIVVVFAGVAWGTAMLYGANQEGRRAADMAALAAAAEIPFVNLDVQCNGASVTTGNPLPCNPMNLPDPSQLDAYKPIANVPLDLNIPEYPGVNWTLGSCGIAARQLETSASPIFNAYKSPHNGHAQCEPTPVFTHLWEQQLADCLFNAPNCPSATLANLQQQSLPGLPATGTPLDQQLQQVLSTAPSLPSGPIVTKDVYDKVAAACNPALVPACTTLLAQLGHGHINVDLLRLAPALLTPAVKITITQHVHIPGASMIGQGDQTITNSAVARRAFKNAIILPSLPSEVNGTPIPIDPNQNLYSSRDQIFSGLDGLNATVTPPLDGAMKTYVCPSNPQSCEVKNAFGNEIDDLRELYNPPPGSQGPTVSDMTSSGSALLVSPLQQINLNSPVLGLDAVTQSKVQAALGLTGNVLYKPAVQFVPVLVNNLQACALEFPSDVSVGVSGSFSTSGGPTVKYGSTGIPDGKCVVDALTNAPKTVGMFRARLIQ